MQRHDEPARPRDGTLYAKEEAAFGRLYMDYFPKVRQFIRCLVKSEEAAEDLSQDIFEHIWMDREHIFDIEYLNAYLFRMARNYSINYLLHKATEDKYARSCCAVDGQAERTVEEDFYARELDLLVRLTVEKMPEQRRRVFELSRMKNLKNAEIAEQLNISKRTVEVHLNLALKQIRKIISLSLLSFL